MTPETTLTAPPEDCTCIWSHYGNEGSTHLLSRSCPAWPHPRFYSASSPDTVGIDQLSPDDVDEGED